MAVAPKSLTTTHEVHEFSSTRKWVIAFSVMLGTVLEVLDSSIVNVSLPHMQGSFSASVDEIAWVVTSYLVAAGIMIPMTGWIAERFGRKRYFVASITMFIVSSALCGVAQSLNQIVFFRLMQGAAGAAMMPLSQAILMETFPPREQAMAMAVWGIGMMVAPIMGPTIGGYITDAWSWRWNFYINVPIGTLAAFMVYRFVDDPAYMRNLRRGRIDLLGIACLFVTLGLGEIVLDRGERADWFHSPWVVYCTAAALISLAILIYHELHTEDPVVDLSILENMNFTLPVTLVIFLTFTLYGTAILNPIFLQETLGYTASKAGLVMAPRGFGTMFSMIILGTYARRGGDIRPLVGIGAQSGLRRAANRLADGVAGNRHRVGIPGVVGGGAELDGKVQDGARGESLFGHAQPGRRDRHVVPDDAADTSAASESEQPRRSHHGLHPAAYADRRPQHGRGIRDGAQAWDDAAVRDGAAAGDDAVVQRHLPNPVRADVGAGADVPIPQARHAQPASRSGALRKIDR
jgi:MFS family permease